MSEVRICANCSFPIEDPKPTQRFCSDRCRAAGWRKQHLTLRCPHCTRPVHARLLVDDEGRSNGEREGADHECD